MIHPESEANNKENPDQWELKTDRVWPSTTKVGFGTGVEPELAAAIKGNALKYHNS